MVCARCDTYSNKLGLLFLVKSFLSTQIHGVKDEQTPDEVASIKVLK